MSYRIFVIFTRYQFQCIQDIIRSQSNEKTIVITTIPINGKEFEGEIYYFEKITSFSSLFHEIKTKERKKTFLQIKDTLISYENINVYIPHYFNIHSNYIATSLFKNCKVHIIPDGILSFYPYQLTKKDVIKQFVNKIVSLSIGLKYKLFFSNIIDPFNQVRKIYSYDPDITYSYGKGINQIPFTTKDIALDQHSNNIIILGTSNKLDKESEIIKKIMNFIKNNKINTIYYKMHPGQKSDSIYTSLSNNINNLKLLTEQVGAENLIEKYFLNTIISVEFSTALLEIQRQYNYQVDCYINKTAFINNSKYKEYFKKLLKYYKIRELT